MPKVENRVGDKNYESNKDSNARRRAVEQPNQKKPSGKPSTSLQQSTTVTMNGVRTAVSHPELLEHLQPLSTARQRQGSPRVSDSDDSMDDGDP